MVWMEILQRSGKCLTHPIKGKLNLYNFEINPNKLNNYLYTKEKIRFIFYMNDKNILEIEVQKEIKCSKQVALWNYWDHEHLDIVHDGYKKSNILYDKKNFMFRLDEIKIPLVPLITFSTPIFMVQDNENDLVVYAIQMGVLSKTVITINEISDRNVRLK